jgi:tetratricopeptide (TPR) repeat protein
MSFPRKSGFLALLITTAAFVPDLWIGPARAEGDTTPSQTCASEKVQADSRVSACTAVIDAETRRSARLRAAALTYRALGWRAKADDGRALTDLTDAIGLDASFAPAFSARADILKEQGKCETAIADVNEAIRLNEKDAGAHFIRASCSIIRGELKLADSDLSEVVKLDKDNAKGLALRALGIKGRLKFAARAFDEAIADYNAAAQLAPNRPLIYIDRAAAWVEKGDTAKALADYDKAIKLDSDNSAGVAATAFAARAKLFDLQGNASRAGQDLNAAIRLNKNSHLYIARAALSEKSGNLESSLSDLRKAIETDPNNSFAFSTLGDLYRKNGDYKLAVTNYQRAIELQPDNLTAYGNRALALFNSGDFDKAAADFAKIYKERPSPYLLLWLHISRSRIDRNVRLDELSSLPADIKVNELPYVLLELFSGRKTIKEVEVGAETPDQKCEALFYIGEWQILKDSKDNAVKTLRDAAAICPKDFAEYGGALSELTRMKP